MDAPRSRDHFDLADIVLSDSAARQRARDEAPAWRERITRADRAGEDPSGFDATSVVILALVVMAVAMILAFAVSALHGSRDTELPAATKAHAPASAVKAGHTTTKRQVAAARPAGAQLAVGRITAKPLRDGTGAVVVRARINDLGRALPSRERQVLATLIIDGGVVGAAPLELVPSSGAASHVTSGTADLTFRTDSCASGTHSVTVIADSTGSVPEAIEADNARSTQLSWTC